jgi:hypothetical protein
MAEKLLVFENNLGERAFINAITSEVNPRSGHREVYLKGFDTEAKPVSYPADLLLDGRLHVERGIAVRWHFKRSEYTGAAG